MIGRPLSTSLCVVVGGASSGQQLGLQTLDLSVLGGQELLQLGDLRLRTKTRVDLFEPGQGLSVLLLIRSND